MLTGHGTQVESKILVEMASDGKVEVGEAALLFEGIVIYTSIFKGFEVLNSHRKLHILGKKISKHQRCIGKDKKQFSKRSSSPCVYI